MRFGLCIPNNQGVEHVRDLVALAAEGEVLGYDSAWVSDHLFHASYVAARLGDRPYHEPLVTLAAIATATSRLLLGTSVLVLPWHHPVRLAKTVASLDDLSRGRVILGVGVAETRDEYANLGIDFAQRGRISDDYLEALHHLWTDDVPSFAGRHIAFDGLRFEPKTTQKPRVPTWIGGSSPAAFRRTARFGDGWHPLSLSPAAVVSGIADLQSAFAAAGRETTALRIAPRVVVEFVDQPWERPVEQRRTARGTTRELIDYVRAFAAAGATDLVVDANTGDLDRARDVYRRFAREVIPTIGDV